MEEMAVMQNKDHKEGLDLKDPLEQLETQDYQYVEYILANYLLPIFVLAFTRTHWYLTHWHGTGG